VRTLTREEARRTDSIRHNWVRLRATYMQPTKKAVARSRYNQLLTNEKFS
jgi:hypothetical protein